VAQQRAVAARLDRGEKAALQRDVRMSDCVNGGVDRVQAAVADADADVLARQTARAELVQ
jgi:hypothetical protein